MALPSFFVIGAPKAGTTALHDALAQHPRLYLSPVKEPKYFMTAGAPQARTNGPGDAHGSTETIWKRKDYEALFDGATAGALRGESSAFYLHDLEAHNRIRRAVPDARLIAVLRDPVDRAYSNWLHLWADGLEPVGDFLEAFAAEPARIEQGWGFFWQYRDLGLYGQQLAHLFSVFPRDQVLLLRYRDLVDQPVDALERVDEFLGVEAHPNPVIPQQNSRKYAPPSWHRSAAGALVRRGAAVGAHFPPQWWRTASTPLLRLLEVGAGPRPRLSVDQRKDLVESFADDIALLEKVTGDSYADWLRVDDRGDFESRARRAHAPRSTSPARAASGVDARQSRRSPRNRAATTGQEARVR